jgi:hypothetical protein
VAAAPARRSRIALLYVSVRGSFGACAVRGVLFYLAFHMFKFLFQNPVALHISEGSCSQNLSFLLPCLLAFCQIATVLRIPPLAWAYNTPSLVPDYFPPRIVYDTRFDKMLGLQRISMYPASSKLSTKERNDQIWEIHKHHIRMVYMDMDLTLKETMQIIRDTHHFKARSVETNTQ